jgi:hypothetical protein
MHALRAREPVVDLPHPFVPSSRRVAAKPRIEVAYRGNGSAGYLDTSSRYASARLLDLYSVRTITPHLDTI